MKLDLILENVRNKYNLGLLEESTTEEELLKGKILINEATMNIRKILVENGLISDTKVILENIMVKGVLGAGGLYAGTRAAGNWMNKKIDDPMDFSFNSEFYVKSPAEMKALFPDSQILIERFWGLPKSIIAIKEKA